MATSTGTTRLCRKGLHPYKPRRCPECAKARRAVHMARVYADPDLHARARETQRRWRQTDKGASIMAAARARRREQDRDAWYRREYGISLAEVKALLVRQSGMCPLCRKSLIGKRQCVDHDHATGQVRGLLHTQCNLLLSVIEDAALTPEQWGRNAQEYLEPK